MEYNIKLSDLFWIETKSKVRIDQKDNVSIEIYLHPKWMNLAKIWINSMKAQATSIEIIVIQIETYDQLCLPSV